MNEPAIFPDAAATVGRTPLVELKRLARGLPGRILAKLEMRNPAGSIKDRLGVALIEDAERRGVLKPGMVIVEATGGNTGIGLAFAAAIRGYRLVLTMPESMSSERVALLRQYGADVVLTPGILMADAVQRAREITDKTPGAINLDQFRNPANPELHRRTTAVEIWEDTAGAVDAFVSAVGTGGTITGVGEFLKSRRPTVKVIAVEPAGAAVLSGKAAGTHQMPGIGVASFRMCSTATCSTTSSPSPMRRRFPARRSLPDRKASLPAYQPEQRSMRRLGSRRGRIGSGNPSSSSFRTPASATCRARCFPDRDGGTSRHLAPIALHSHTGL